MSGETSWYRRVNKLLYDGRYYSSSQPELAIWMDLRCAYASAHDGRGPLGDIAYECPGAEALATGPASSVVSFLTWGAIAVLACIAIFAIARMIEGFVEPQHDRKRRLRSATLEG